MFIEVVMFINRNMRTVFLGFEPLNYLPEIRELAKIDMDSLFVSTAEELMAVCATGAADSIVMGVEGPSTFTLIRAIKSDYNTNLPLLVLLSVKEAHLEPRLLMAGADEVVIAPWNIEALQVRLERLSRKHLMQLGIEGQSGVMQALAQTVEKHDIYTSQHIERLRFLSGQLAMQLGQPPKVVAEIRAAGLLHDIGKIAVPQNILQKPGGLTASEWEVMRQHPIHGAEIALNLPFGKEIAPMVRGHHERWDGSGYPDNLSGESIPIGARIVAVVDAFDAMTSRRSYRQAMSISDAKIQLIQGIGSQFDKTVVEGLMQLNPTMLQKQFHGTLGAAI
jgi:putative two-component system response regulator